MVDKMKKRTAITGGTAVTRREFMGTTAKAVAAGTVAASFPYISTGNEPLRTIGLGVSIINEIQSQASKDLGFEIRGQALGYGAMFGKMLNQNDQYDIAEGYYNDFDVFIPSKVWHPTDTTRVKEWDSISDLSKTGKLTPDSKEGDGDAPFRKLWLNESGDLVEGPTRWVSAVPTWHNADTLGYNPEETGGKLESWGSLFDEKFRGRVALLNVPQIGVMDAAMGAEAIGLVKFGDKGDMTRGEIDILMDFLIEKKREGHFRAFWETFGQSVNLMVSGEVAVQSLWSPAVTAIRSEGVPCIYADLKEGYRGWHGGLSISNKVSGKKLDQAYEYINWWLEGWAGAFVARQGYYMSPTENVKKYLEPEEWDYWYMGKAAAKELMDPFGNPLVPKGEVRDGGSYLDRFSNIGVWNSLMKENDYLVKRWTEFLTA